MKVNFTLKFLVFFAIQYVVSQNLVLDPTFGVNGKVTNVINESTFTLLTSIVVQPDGKIIACGTATDDDANPLIFLCRYEENGTVDSAFGVNGMVMIPPATDYAQLYLYKVEILDNNQILVIGTQLNQDNLNKPFILRCHSDGTLDTSFGTNGILFYDSFPGQSVVTSVSWYPDGRMLLSGTTQDVTSNAVDLFVARISEDYTLDTAFALNGYLTFNCGTTADANTITVEKNIISKILSDASILVAGSSSIDNLSDFFVLKLNSSGTVDATFGNQGRTITDLGANDFLKAIHVMDDGKIILSGSRTAAGIASSKYNIDGSPDITYAENGKSSLFFNAPNGYNAGVGTVDSQLVGTNLLMVGHVLFNSYDDHIMLASIDVLTGVLNSSFGTNGFLLYDYIAPPQQANSSNPFELARVSLLQNDGKLLIGGTAQIPYGNPYFTLLRYQDTSLQNTEMIGSEMKIHPNPFQNQIHISGLTTSNALIELYDVSGRLLTSDVFQNEENYTLPINENLTNGTYFLKIKSDQKTETHKIIKQ
jgi:uncharacterized delta-60 repeat protein